MLVGLIIYLVPDELEGLVTFDPEVFFYVLLPPILLHAGMTMDSFLFFRYIGPILTFSFFGTALTAITTGLLQWVTSFLPFVTTLTLKESLLFGALISATDTVTVLAIFKEIDVEPSLYALVFGESALNDAIAITLFNVVESYTGLQDAVGTSVGVFFLSILLGVGVAVFCSLLTKHIPVTDDPVMETCLLLLLSYMSYLIAEVSHLSGIVTILTCGIVQGHYTIYNVSHQGKELIEGVLGMFSFFAENFIFGYLGVSIFTYPGLEWEVSSMFLGLFNCLAGRAVGVFSMSFILNAVRAERNQIPFRQQTMMWFSGLRGAVAFALAIENSETRESRVILATTLFIVITTVYVCGSLAIPVAEYLQVTSESRKAADTVLDAEVSLTGDGFPMDEFPMEKYGEMGTDEALDDMEVDMSDIPSDSVRLDGESGAPIVMGRFEMTKVIVKNRVEEFFYSFGHNYLTPFLIRRPSLDKYERMDNTEDDVYSRRASQDSRRASQEGRPRRRSSAQDDQFVRTPLNAVSEDDLSAAGSVFG
ncbi:hypothetical protein SARC_00023 [Sphaeroforma arctica JP610]|uniref:Sodium/hydrogen exchanger n=1 Tax=Sphaeroforma arctica JP610 TaxID=667725 RepID=A0A0L0GGC3_9EUKA|nr:hypothetical protein SARC_00023 [Sphaeroforma arctica JP610]KNC87891.1 hypothetical protein SARC_00023 [Sphaeroforma arctica JP610]|eukprot:XP_014161793.1 hypothetical protein SARC_00023 [Sphaeroforma arctica JP610]